MLLLYTVHKVHIRPAYTIGHGFVEIIDCTTNKVMVTGSDGKIGIYAFPLPQKTDMIFQKMFHMSRKAVHCA
jgi:hypothetical protein